jgi:hypothetical protein
MSSVQLRRGINYMHHFSLLTMTINRVNPWDKQNLMPRMTGAFKYYTLMISTKTIRKNIGKIDGSYINTPAGKYYSGSSGALNFVYPAFCYCQIT